MVDTESVTQAAHFLSSGSISAVIGLLISVMNGLPEPIYYICTMKITNK